MKTFVHACLMALATAQGTFGDLEFTSIGQFKSKHAAFVQTTKFEDSDDFLLVTDFSGMPYSVGHVSIVEGVKEAVTAGDVSSLKSTTLDTGATFFAWPNNAMVIPNDVFGFRSIVVPDGFLVPTHNDGGVYVIQMDDSDLTKVTQTVEISPKKDGYFYHMGQWLDLNGDGRKDFLTARSNAKAGGGELVWFEHPEGGLGTAPWTEHVVASGPDVGIEIEISTDFYKDEVVVFAAQFFDQKLALYRVSTKDGTLVGTRTIDDTTILDAYSVALVDLNGDGKKELLVNNHEKDDKTNGVYAYTVPSDLMTGEFKKYTLASDFKNARSLTVPNMAPGFPYAVWPQGYKKGERAHILVAGDGGHDAHVLVPSGDSSEFDYENDIVVKAGGTVGALATADFDGDGWLEMYMPNYDKGYIEVFKLSAASDQTTFLQ